MNGQASRPTFMFRVAKILLKIIWKIENFYNIINILFVYFINFECLRYKYFHHTFERSYYIKKIIKMKLKLFNLSLF